MAKFLLGTALGAVLAFVFVRFNWEPPAVLDLPEKLQKNIVSTAIEGDLYDLSRDAETRTRALEVYFKNRAGDAAKVDAAAGHPFLKALYRARAAREARLLTMQWTAYDKALEKPALRASLERKHGVTDADALKRAMLFDALDRKPFLKSWLNHDAEPVTAREFARALNRNGRNAVAVAIAKTRCDRRVTRPRRVQELHSLCASRAILPEIWFLFAPPCRAFAHAVHAQAAMTTVSFVADCLNRTRHPLRASAPDSIPITGCEGRCLRAGLLRRFPQRVHRRCPCVKRARGGIFGGHSHGYVWISARAACDRRYRLPLSRQQHVA